MTDRSAEPETGELAEGPRRLAVVALGLGIMSAVGSGALVIVALPAIAAGLGIEAARSVWIVNIYQLGTVVTILVASAAGESWGYRRVYLCGLALLIAASLGAASAATLPVLLGWRVFQGVGAAAMMAVNAALIRHIWPASKVGRGISYNATVIAGATAVSPILAGMLVAVADWRLLFLIHVPLGLVAWIIGFRVLPAKGGSNARIDALSAVLNAMAFCGLFFAAQGVLGSQAAMTIGVELMIGLLTASWLLQRSRGRAAPLVPLDLLKIGLLRRSYAASFFAFVAQTIVLVVLPFALTREMGLDQLGVGIVMTAWPLALGFAALATGRAIERHSPEHVSAVGLAIFSVGVASLAITMHMSELAVAISAAFCGLGYGTFTTPNNRTMLMNAPLIRSGAATGMIATVRLAGQTTGALMIAAFLKGGGDSGMEPFVCAAFLGLLAAGLAWSRKPLAVRDD